MPLSTILTFIMRIKCKSENKKEMIKLYVGLRPS